MIQRLRALRIPGGLDLTLVVLAVLAVITRTPPGGLLQSVVRASLGYESTLPPLSTWFQAQVATGADAAEWLQAPGAPLSLEADAFPEPWRTAVRRQLAKKTLPRELREQLAARPEATREEQLIGALDEAWKASPGHPDRHLEALVVGDAQHERAIARSRSSGERHPEAFEGHRRYLPASAVNDVQRLVEPTLALATVLRLQWPLELPHRVTSPYGDRIHPVVGKAMFHNGVDLGVPVGTPVHAAQSGTVAVVNRNDRSGIFVVIDHGHGVRTGYCHLDRVLVAPGDRVGRGQVFSRSGNTGRSTGPHLHYLVRISGKTVDPLSLGRPPAPKTGS